MNALYLAGDENIRWNFLLERITLITQKMEEQGIVYDSASGIIIEVEEGCVG